MSMEGSKFIELTKGEHSILSSIFFGEKGEDALQTINYINENIHLLGDNVSKIELEEGTTARKQFKAALTENGKVIGDVFKEIFENEEISNNFPDAFDKSIKEISNLPEDQQAKAYGTFFHSLGHNQDGTPMDSQKIKDNLIKFSTNSVAYNQEIEKVEYDGVPKDSSTDIVEGINKFKEDFINNDKIPPLFKEVLLSRIEIGEEAMAFITDPETLQKLMDGVTHYIEQFGSNFAKAIIQPSPGNPGGALDLIAEINPDAKIAMGNDKNNNVVVASASEHLNNALDNNTEPMNPVNSLDRMNPEITSLV